jgi:hypothetical protein
MDSTVTTIKDGTLTLPQKMQKSWKETKAFVESLDSETVIIRRFNKEQDRPNYDIDDALWKSMRKESRVIRKKLFQEYYPDLYAKLRKKKA